MAYCYCNNCKTNNVEHTTRYLYDNRSYNINKFGNTEYNEYLYQFQCNRCKYTSYRVGNDDNATQLLPIEPAGEPLSDEIPEDIRKDFDEARLVVNYSIRGANVLMRICTEKICNLIGETFLQDSKDVILNATLNNKISIIKSKNAETSLNAKVFDMLTILQKYGNDNAHSIKEICDSDTRDSFDTLQTFIHAICKNIILILETDAKIKQMKI